MNNPWWWCHIEQFYDKRWYVCNPDGTVAWNQSFKTK